MVEIDSQYLSSYIEHRPNSVHIINDATQVDYKKVFEENNAPLSFDYLQIDLEVNNGSTLMTLYKLDNEIFETYKFATVTFEHDIYNGNFTNTRLESRNIFKKRGYICVFEDINNRDEHTNQDEHTNLYPYEDWYVHPDLVDMNYVNNLIENNRTNYVNYPLTEKTLYWKDIQYPSI